MKFSLKLLPIIILIYFTASSPITIKSNIYNKISLNQEVTEIILSTNNYNYITIELIFSNQSNYFTSFNEYNSEIESNSFKEFQKSNQTDLIIKSELFLGKNKILLRTKDSNKNDIILTIFEKEKKDNKGQNDFVYIKYSLSENIESEKYMIKNTKIQLEQDSEFLYIYFDGINQIDEEINLENLKSDFDIKIFDKIELESLYENIYVYIYDNEKLENKALSNRSMKFKGKTVKSDMFIKIELNKNDNKEQIILISAKVNYNNIEESFLHYEYLTFQNFKENENNNNGTNGNKEDSQEEEVKANRENNKKILFIITGSFVVIIIISFISIVSYIKCHEVSNENVIEEDQDYSNIGGIINKSEVTEKEDTTEDSRTNEELMN